MTDTRKAPTVGGLLQIFSNPKDILLCPRLIRLCARSVLVWKPSIFVEVKDHRCSSKTLPSSFGLVLFFNLFKLASVP